MQIPYPCNAVVPGMIKMNMARFVLRHETQEWRFVLKDNWMTAATLPGGVIKGQQLSPMVCTSATVCISHLLDSLRIWG